MKDNLWVEDSSGKPPVGTKRRRVGKRRIEFVGWGSRPLIEFLEAIGQDTTKEHSRHDVAVYITKYVNENNLASAEKKKKILCDERLYALFGKKSMFRIKVFEMLEEHFAENHSDSDSEQLNSSDEEGYRQKGLKNIGNNQMKRVRKIPRSCFAAIVPENMKLVYLKKCLIQELLKAPESFECKIVGSFVRIKSDPNDIYQKNRFQLQQVTGIEKMPGTGDACMKIHLRVSNFFKDIPICELSDDNFSEEEIVDLRDRIKAGLLKRLTVSEVESKAEMLHADITKHWIEKELSLLPNLIARANEKGWRRELFEHLERRKKLQSPSEQEKLLQKIPEVIAEEPEPKDTVAIASEKAGSNHPTQSIAMDNAGVPGNVPESEDVAAPVQPNTQVQNGNTNGFIVEPAEDTNGHHHASETPRQGDQNTNFVPVVTVPYCNGVMHSEATENVGQRASEDIHIEVIASGNEEVHQERPQGTVVIYHDSDQENRAVVIELSDDDEPLAEAPMPPPPIPPPPVNPNAVMWHYIDPRGQTQGPFSLIALRRWSEARYFPPDFTVWRSGQTPNDAELLPNVLARNFPNG